MERNFKKELMLKGNSVKRLVKEYNSYDKEVQTLNTKLDELKAQESDDYQLKKQNEFITDSVQVRDSVKEKLRKATDDLVNLVNEVNSEEIKAFKEYTDALEYLNQSSELFAKLNN